MVGQGKGNVIYFDNAATSRPKPDDLPGRRWPAAFPQGVVRFGFGYFNKEEIEAALEAIRELARARGRVKEGAADPAWPGGRCFSVRSA